MFDYDEKILQAIKEGEKTTNNFNDEIDVEVVEFKGVGTKDLRKYNVCRVFCCYKFKIIIKKCLGFKLYW